MNEHIKKILDHKLIYYIHMVIYVIFILVNVETVFDPEVKKLGYPLPAAVVFTVLFAIMFISETISYYSSCDLFEKGVAGACFRMAQILGVTVFYFMVPVELGAGASLVAIVLFAAETAFYYPFYGRLNRVLIYIVFGIALEIVAIWKVLYCDAVYQGINLIVSTTVVFFSAVILCELVIKTYLYFVRLLFAQNRTVEDLNEANSKLKEQQQQIKRTNEMLGLQKIKLQAANKEINLSRDEMSVQNEISNEITSTMEIGKLLKDVCRIMRIRLDMDYVGVIMEPDPELELPGDEAGKREVYSSCVFDEAYEKYIRDFIVSGGAEDLLVLPDTYIQNMDVRKERPDFRAYGGKVLESLIVVPLKRRQQRMGNLLIGKRSINAFVEKQTFYETLASQLSIGISNKKLYEQMRQMAIRDGLTRIYNRRHLIELLNGYLSEAIQKKSSVSIALFDIDKFKMVNDTYGHPCGDVVICHVASLLRQAAVSNGGIAGRYGGEEFVIAFQGKTLAEVYEIVKKVHKKIKTESVVYEDKTLNVCVSAGVASYPETCENPSDLLTRADWAMYHSKRNGRDRITIDSDELETKM